jgi:hypothetical protein
MHSQERVNPKLELRSLYFSGIFILLLLFSCANDIKKNNNDLTEVVEGTYILPKTITDSLINRSINFNDTLAYSYVSSYFIKNDIGEQFFLTAFQMANKYSYSEAYYNIYEILVDRGSVTESIKKLDDKNKYFALFCLLKSRELGYKWCKIDIEEIFLDKTVPSSNYYIRKFNAK